MMECIPTRIRIRAWLARADRGSNEARFESRACFAAGNVKKSPAEAGLFTLGAYTSIVNLDAQSQTWMRGLYQMPRYPSQTGAPRVQ